MSTFNGLVAEFPDIRVDYFRSHADLGPPLACFLSHIHSDHLAGLETLRSPFVYCSAATREMLLRLERFPCRINYANGILEARIQRYRHLRNLLKPLPLETPTTLELSPGNNIQVTLFDANHCPGAVMFLLEGQGKAVLYTGDIRSEPWFVNAIARSPPLIEYSSGLKTLDTIYLDTSFVDDVEFPTKSEGISELLQKVSRYPADTIFHFQAWTYGYEDVWIALSKALGSRIHVDEYKMLMFRSLVSKHPDNQFAPQLHLAPEAPGLVGFMCGNTYHPGCLTLDETVRLHSCEKGNYCQTVQKSPVVWIRPIIARLPDGLYIAEVGVGGGGDDLEREAELDYLSVADIESFLEVLRDADYVAHELEEIRQFLLSAVANGRKVPLDLERAAFKEDNKTDLVHGIQAITNRLKLRNKQLPPNGADARALPNVITFPYSRHSSYTELCNLVNTFRPGDVWPCTVDVPRWLLEDITVNNLFSEQCSGNKFRHDEMMRERFGDQQNRTMGEVDSQVSVASAVTLLYHSPAPLDEPVPTRCDQRSPIAETSAEDVIIDTRTPDSDDCMHTYESTGLNDVDPTRLRDSQESTISAQALEIRLTAFQAVLANAQGRAGVEIGLLSTTDNHSKLDEDLTFT
ncbi:DNA repair metallo-beta-lactamase domain-containing protein [Madurella fahalii]|uniref:DNA repair metallo-beta-lactamase domain-containing protein n=1 Tax=Madurella fahalii TaxID=1157608 RepID=A0ABQ0GDU8_9PEZI